jgi:hypothetical protein
MDAAWEIHQTLKGRHFEFRIGFGRSSLDLFDGGAIRGAFCFGYRYAYALFEAFVAFGRMILWSRSVVTRRRGVRCVGVGVGMSKWMMWMRWIVRIIMVWRRWKRVGHNGLRSLWMIGGAGGGWRDGIRFSCGCG